MINDVTVIGDVHGCYKTLLALLDKIPDQHKKRICFAGDLIDRGPMSKQVVEFVIQNGYDCVVGNHELMMVDWTRRFSDMLWLGNGGNDTRRSYCAPADSNTPHIRGPVDEELFVKHQEWMRTLPVVIEYPECKTPDGRRLVVSHSLCHNYWNGNNWKTLVIDCGNFQGYPDLEIMESEETEKILNEFETKEFVSESFGAKRYESENYIFIQSQFASAWEDFEVLEK